MRISRGQAGFGVPPYPIRFQSAPAGGRCAPPHPQAGLPAPRSFSGFRPGGAGRAREA